MGLQRAQTLHSHPFPLASLASLLLLAVGVPHGVKLWWGAPAKVVYTHPDTPHRYAQQLFRVGYFFRAGVSVTFFLPSSAICRFHASTSCGVMLLQNVSKS